MFDRLQNLTDFDELHLFEPFLEKARKSTIPAEFGLAYANAMNRFAPELSRLGGSDDEVNQASLEVSQTLFGFDIFKGQSKLASYGIMYAATITNFKNYDKFSVQEAKYSEVVQKVKETGLNQDPRVTEFMDIYKQIYDLKERFKKDAAFSARALLGTEQVLTKKDGLKPSLKLTDLTKTIDTIENHFKNPTNVNRILLQANSQKR
jgi:hypothetical protein